MKLLYVLAIGMVLSTSVLADDEPLPERKAFVAAQGGLGVVTSTGGGTMFIYGARAGYGLLGNSHVGLLSAGLFGMGFSNSSTVGTVTASGTFYMVGPELLARKAFGTGLYFGARAGLSASTTTISVGSVSFSGSMLSYVVGPVAGYEIPIMDRAAIILDASWFSVGGGTANFPGLGSFNLSSSSAATFQTGISFSF